LLQAHGSGSCSGSPLRLCSSARVSQSRASHRGRKRTGRAGGAHPRLRIVRQAGRASPGLRGRDARGWPRFHRSVCRPPLNKKYGRWWRQSEPRPVAGPGGSAAGSASGGRGDGNNGLPAPELPPGVCRREDQFTLRQPGGAGARPLRRERPWRGRDLRLLLASRLCL